MSLKKIAVVILNWNGEQLLEQFLPTLLAFSTEATVYVADNNSTDQSLTLLKNKFPSVKIISNSGNFGFAKGYNVALQNVEEPYYVLVNSDVEVTENWLTPILSIFENEPNTAIIQPKLLDFKDKNYFEYAGAAGGFIDQFGYPYCRGRIFETLEEDFGQYDNNIDLFWASGACFFIRKAVFRELNGFDDDFFAHQEEIDLCWRARNSGYAIKFCNQSKVYHVGGATLSKANPHKTFLNFRNSLLMLLKNLPKNKIAPIIFSRLCLDGIAGLTFLFSGNPKHCGAIIRAHFDFYKLFLKTLKKRTAIQKPDYFKSKSILFQYYIKGSKVFEQN
ncbi:glycosyltransferase family 2 protein [Flavobacterium aciduliphilum]|uniref:GT2 family glycosyltransferase n=1 Tax=Flavobacterium aciduliphilum TaxID=1101402 RepID=A0A328YBU8_9FLAO|nr:glycosyltransferase family 2 protein [Flavobacterium aciduliphilum]RAR70684.1 GT2 family glycosyltransferase [Flavobacterium aciduliphilum]